MRSSFPSARFSFASTVFSCASMTFSFAEDANNDSSKALASFHKQRWEGSLVNNAALTFSSNSSFEAREERNRSSKLITTRSGYM